MSQIRIACTALVKRIMAGKVSKNGLDFVGNPVDVTSDALKAVIDFLGESGSHVVTQNGKPLYEISVKKIVEEKPAVASTLPEQISQAQTEMAGWTQERKDNCQLQGS